MSDKLKTGLFAGVITYAVVACVLAGCGFTFANYAKTFEVPESGQAVNLEPGTRITHNQGKISFKRWQASIAQQAEQWRISGEASAEQVGVYDGLLYGTLDFLSSDDGGALVAAVPGGVLVGALAGYFTRRRGDVTQEKADDLWDEAYDKGAGKARVILASALELAKARNEQQIADVLTKGMQELESGAVS